MISLLLVNSTQNSYLGPNRPHPIFKSFIEASLKYQQNK